MFFVITGLSLMMFLMLNIRIQTVLNDKNGTKSRRMQLVLELPNLFMDDSPIHDDDIIDTDTTNSNNTIITPTSRESFSYLFDTIPHDCVMESDCHLYLSDSPQFIDKTMVVIGMVRDSEKDIIATLQQLDEISCIFDKIVFIFYESNSKDNTPYVMEDWSEMYLDHTHCSHFKYNPLANNSSKRY